VAAGLEAWEMYAYMDQHKMTLVVPGGSTVGAYGGWMAGGGHSTLGSLYGLGSDQALSLQVVTADGRFVTADPDTNTDLYYALRGGGPGTSLSLYTQLSPLWSSSF
jgi:FAD/FMN-containing dehydrogenase